MLTSRTPVALALDDALQEMGRRLADDPARLRAVLLDELGAAARDHRPEVDAVVAAAAAGVPAELLARRRGRSGATDDELAARATERGALPALAQAAVITWGSALRVDSASLDTVTAVPAASPPPPISTPTEESRARADGAAGPAAAAAGAAPPVAGPRPPEEETVVAAPRPSAPAAAAAPVAGVAAAAATAETARTTESTTPGAGHARERRGGALEMTPRVLVALLLAVVLVAAGAGWLAAGLAGGSSADGNEDDIAAAAATTAPAASSPATSDAELTEPTDATATGMDTMGSASPVVTTDAAVVPVAAPPVLQATGDMWTASLANAEQHTHDRSQHVWAGHPVPLAASGTFDKITVVSQEQPHHGSLNTDPGTSTVTGTQLVYTPMHNGEFTDTVTVQLVDSATGQTSAPQPITLHVMCGPEDSCH